jgi:hypothetical protein
MTSGRWFSYAVISAVTPFVPACAWDLAGWARNAGASDLQCPVEHVSAYRARGGVYVARGCGQWVEYNCLATRYDVTCIPRVAPEVHDDSAP